MTHTLHAKSIPDLAAYQTRQVGNTCSFHAIATALHMLLDYSLDPHALSAEVNRLWWRGRFMRVAPNWAVTPRMQVRTVRHLAKTHALPVTAELYHGNSAMLLALLANTQRRCVPIITLIWSWGQAPPIYLGDTAQNFNAVRSAGGHSMILAAYDRNHTAADQFPTPWGFINPWKSNAEHLFWMTDADFRKAWRFPLPWVGPNPVVLIKAK